MIKDSKILVTGGAGFIGSHIVESLVEKGADVVIYDNLSTGSIANFSASAVKFICGDILDRVELEKAMKGIDVVSHHAAQLDIIQCIEDPQYDIEKNVFGTLSVLEIAKKCGVKKIINASSSAVYGQSDSPLAENTYPRPNWPYGVSKLAAEGYCNIYNDYHGLPVVNLRYGYVYGEREWYRRAQTIFVKRAVMGQPLIIFGGGIQIRDFIYVKDAVAFHNLCVETELFGNKTYNVGSGIGISIAELADTVERASGKTLGIKFEEVAEGAESYEIKGKIRNPAELGYMVLDIAKAERIGWHPETSLLEGMKLVIDWASQNIHRWKEILRTK